MERSLYIKRQVMNAQELLDWAKEQGFTSSLPPEDLHVTIAYSRRPVDWEKLPPSYASNIQLELSRPYTPRVVRKLGDKGAVVLVLGDEAYSLFDRNKSLRDAGCSWDWPEYHPHITITYSGAPDSIESIVPFNGQIILGPEQWDTVKEDFASTITEDSMAKMRFYKIDEEKRLVYGWASVTTIKGKPVIDHQGDIIETDDLLEAAHEFMLGEQEAGLMHVLTTGIGKVVESVVLSADLQKALGIDLGMEGWLIGVKIEADPVWKDIKAGKLQMFSIGGSGVRTAA